MREAAGGLLCGVDTGGTFTDCVAIDEAGRLWTAKVPSTPPDFERGFFEGIGLREDGKAEGSCFVSAFGRFLYVEDDFALGHGGIRAHIIRLL